MSDRRLNQNTSIEIRKVDESEEMHIEGKAVAFNSPETYYGETEIIDPRALDDADMSDVVLRYNHNDTQYTLARTRNGSLRLDLREDGLYFDADLIDTTTNKDAYKMIKAGLIDKCSFAFTIGEDEYDTKNHLRTIKKINHLYDCAIVDFPYYKNTEVFARSLDNREDFLEKANELQAQEYKKQKEQLIYQLDKKDLLERLK